MALTAGVAVARWWTRRSGKLAAGVGFGLLVAAVGMTGPVGRAGKPSRSKRIERGPAGTSRREVPPMTCTASTDCRRVNRRASGAPAGDWPWPRRKSCPSPSPCISPQPMASPASSRSESPDRLSNTPRAKGRLAVRWAGPGNFSLPIRCCERTLRSHR